MSTKGVTPEQDEIVTEILIAAPPERVFKALTDARRTEAMVQQSGVSGEDVGNGSTTRSGAYRYSTEKGSIYRERGF